MRPLSLLLAPAALPFLVHPAFAQSRAVPPSPVVIDGVTVEREDAPQRRESVRIPMVRTAGSVVRSGAASGGAARAASGTSPNIMDVPAGQVVVSIAARRLYYGVDRDHVRSYPIAVGKSGAQWRGTVVVGGKAMNPGWRPTANQRRKRRLPAYVPPGRSNPLGVRAIYLHRGGRDTLLRIHGTNQPSSIGRAVSSGCIRMLNADVSDLYSRVKVGTLVTAR